MNSKFSSRTFGFKLSSLSQPECYFQHVGNLLVRGVVESRAVRMEWGNGAHGGVVNSTWSSPGGVVSSTWSSPGAFSSTWSSPGAVLSSTGSHLDGGFWRVQRLCFLRNNENVTTKSADLYSDYQLSKKPPRASKSLCRCQTSMSGCTNPTEG